MKDKPNAIYKPVKIISILGCGWFGTPLAQALIKLGYLVKGSTTTPEKLKDLSKLGIKAFLIDVQEYSETDENTTLKDFFDCDVLVINIPPRRNTSAHHSFNQKIARITQLALENKVSEVLFISSTSIYGDCNAEVDEHSSPNPDSDSGKILLGAEHYLQNQRELRTTIIRFGGLIGPQRNPGRFLSGKIGVPNGKAPVNLIHLEDCLGITVKVIQQQSFGHIFNAVAPSHPNRQAFYTQAAINAQLPPPHFIPEIQRWKKVNSIYLYSRLNYSFRLPDWEDWI